MMFAPHHFWLSCAAILYGIRSVNGGVVTLYYVSQPTTSISGTITPTSFSVEEAGTTVASVIGPGDAGMTRYEIQQVQSKLVLHQPDTTVTFIDTDSPWTLTYTIEQGASTAYASAPPLITHPSSTQITFLQGLRQNCTLDISKNTGACVEEDQIPDIAETAGVTGTSVSTSSKTFSGPLLPLATVAISDANPKSRVMIVETTFLLGAMLVAAMI